MSDEVQETTTEETVDDTQDVTESQEQPAEANTVDGLPDWTQDLIKELRQENAKHRKEKTAAQKAVEQQEQQLAEEQGKYKELWEKSEAKRIELETKLTGAELGRMREAVARRHNLTDGLAKRLQGETEEELEEDAKALLAEIPKPQAQTATDGGAGVNQTPPTQMPEDYEIQEMAAKLGVNFSHLKQSLERQARS